MTVQMILLPVFVLVGLTFFMVFGPAVRRGRLEARERGAGTAGPFELPMLFYVLIAIAMPIRHADLIIVMLSWVFVVTQFADAGFITISGNGQSRSLAWYAGALVLLAMWLYFALKLLLGL
jgi:hypothetical protein